MYGQIPKQLRAYSLLSDAGVRRVSGGGGPHVLRTLRLSIQAATAAGDDLNLIPGSFVVHAKKPELGSGEILSAYDGRIEIRFASGERTFMVDLVTKHLKVTSEAPAKPEPKKRATKKKVAAVAAAPK